MHPKHSSSIPKGPMWKGRSIMALKRRLHLHPCTLLGAVNAWVDLSDRKNPSLSPSCGWMPLLNVQGGCGGQPLLFSPPQPLWDHCIIQKRHLLSHALPCTSLAPSLTCQPVKPKKGRRRRRERGGKKTKAAFKNSFWALYCSSLTVLFQLTGLGYFENFLSIIAGIFMCQLFHSRKYSSSLTCCLKPPMFNTSIENSMLDFFFPLAVLQLLSFCLAMQHTQKGTKQKIASMFNSRLASTESSAPHKSSAQKSHLLLEA